MILSTRASVLKRSFSESRDLVAARVATRSLLSRLDAALQVLRNEIAHRVFQQIVSGAEEIPQDVKELHAEAASIETLQRSATDHLEEIERFARILSGEETRDLDERNCAVLHDHSRRIAARKNPLLVIESAGLFAYGCVTAAGFKVGRGSLYRKVATPSLFRIYLEERDEIERLGVVGKAADGQWVYLKDHVFRAPGVAAMVTFGVAKSGNAWAPATAHRVKALMSRHAINEDPELVSVFKNSDRFVLQDDENLQSSGAGDEVSLRSFQLRTHALRSFSPDGRAVGENRWEGVDSRVLHLTRVGQSPWKFQVRRDDLEWILQEPDRLMTRSIILICGARGFIPVRAQDIKDLIAGHWAKGMTEKAYAVIGVKVLRGDQMEISLCGTSRLLKNPVTIRE